MRRKRKCSGRRGLSSDVHVQVGNLADVNKSSQWLKKVGPDNTEARRAGAGSEVSGLYKHDAD